jgi:uncharacterized protein (TIGR03435 family)
LPASKNELALMLQALLADRFGLRLHRELRDSPTYAMVVSKRGFKAKRSRNVETASFTAPEVQSHTQPDGRILSTFRNYSPRDFALWLSGPLATISPHSSDPTYGVFPVVDRTGNSQVYDFTLEFELSAARIDSGGLQLFAAIETQLGLKLEKSKEPLEVLIIDHMSEMPTEN